MGVHGPVPKRSDQRHGHRKAEPVTRIPAAPRWEDEDGNIIYGVVARDEIMVREVPDVIYTSVRLRPGIEFEDDPED